MSLACAVANRNRAKGIAWQIDPGTVQLQTDAYASQHATNPDPRNRQSVAAHLMSLCATLEMRLPAGATTRLLGEWRRRPGGFPDFTSPPPPGDVTVTNVWATTDRDELTARVVAWARSAWASYTAVHATVRALLAEQGIR